MPLNFQKLNNAPINIPNIVVALRKFLYLVLHSEFLIKHYKIKADYLILKKENQQ